MTKSYGDFHQKMDNTLGEIETMQSFRELQNLKNRLPAIDPNDFTDTELAGVKLRLKEVKLAIEHRIADWQQSMSVHLANMEQRLVNPSPEDIEVCVKESYQLSQKIRDHVALERQYAKVFEQLGDKAQNVQQPYSQSLVIAKQLGELFRQFTLLANFPNDKLNEIAKSLLTFKKQIEDLDLPSEDLSLVRGYFEQIRNYFDRKIGPFDPALYPELQLFLNKNDISYPKIALKDRRQALATLKPLYEAMVTLGKEYAGAGEALTADALEAYGNGLQQIEAEYVTAVHDEYSDYLAQVQQLTHEYVGKCQDAKYTAALRDMLLAATILNCPTDKKQKIHARLDALNKAQSYKEFEAHQDVLNEMIDSQDGGALMIWLCKDKLEVLGNGLKQKAHQLLQDVKGDNPDWIKCAQRFLSLRSEYEQIVDKGFESIASLSQAFWLGLNGNLSLRKAVGKQFYLDPLYWVVWSQKINDCTTLDDLEAVVQLLFVIKKDISQSTYPESERVAIIAQLNTQINDTPGKLLRLLAGKPLDGGHEALNTMVNPAFVENYPGITMAERSLAAGVITTHLAKLDAIAQALPSDDENAILINSTLPNIRLLQRHYAQVEVPIEDIQKPINVAYVAFAGYPAQQAILEDLYFDVSIMGYKSEDQKQFVDIKQALFEAQSPSALVKLLSNRSKKVLETINDIASRTYVKLSAEVDTVLEQLIQEVNAPDANLELIAEKYLTLRPDVEASIDSVRLHRGFVTFLRDKLASYQGDLGPALKTFKLDRFYEANHLGDFAVTLQSSATDLPDKKLNKLADRFFKIKAKLDTASANDEERSHNIIHLNKLADMMLKLVVNRPAPDEKFAQLALFFKPEYPGIEFTDRITQMAYFDSWRKVLEEKKTDLETRKEDEAVTAAAGLITSMQDCRAQYVRGFISLQDYKNKAEAAIKTAHHDLDKHRGWKQVLINLAFAVVTLGIGYLAMAIYRKTLFPAMLVNTESKEILDGLEQDVSASLV